MTPDLLVLLLWPLSALLMGFVGFRVGMWSRRIQGSGDHPHRHGDDGDVAWQNDSRGEQEPEMEPPPAVLDAPAWRIADAETEVLPRVQDILPPLRATPIRRPPWVGVKHQRGEE